MTISSAQVKIAAVPGTPHPGAMLEVESNSSGFLLPRISLTSNTMQLNNVTPPNGMMVYNINTSTATGLAGSGLYIWNGQWSLLLENDLANSVGSYKLSVANTMEGYLLCNGDAVSRTTYANLFALVGTTFGSGNGTSTFNLPDFRGRVFGGIGAGAGLTTRTLGNVVGSENVTLTAAQMPNHRHRTSLGAGGNDGTFGNTASVGDSTVYTEVISGSPNKSGSVAWTDYAGNSSPAPHDVMQPTLFAGNTFIKF